MSLVTIRNLSRAFGPVPVFHDLGFSVDAADRLAILGASGTGKSTLLRLLAGLDRPSGGEIECAPDLRIGMVFQDLALWPNLTALQNVTLTLHSLPRDRRRKAGFAALEKCHVADFAGRLPGTLSIGQQQRVALARAIVMGPALLLLDEPFSSLDLVLKHELFETIRLLAAGCALVLVTHDPLEAVALCHTALVLEAGGIVEHGPLRKLLAQPRSQLLRLFQQQLSYD